MIDKALLPPQAVHFDDRVIDGPAEGLPAGVQLLLGAAALGLGLYFVLTSSGDEDATDEARWMPWFDADAGGVQWQIRW